MRGASSGWCRRARRARRWRCGAVRRSTTSPASRSPPPRSAGSRSCGSRPSSWRSTATWTRAATARSWASSRRWWRTSRCARGCTRSECWRCTAAADRPTRSRPTVRRGRRWSRRSGSSRDLSCAGCTRRSCARTRRSTRPRAEPRQLPPELDAEHAAGGPRDRAGLAARALAASARRRRPARAGRWAERDRQDAAGGRAGRRGAPRRRRGALCLGRRRAGGAARRCGREAARRPTLLVLDDVDRAGDEARGARRARRRAGGAAAARASRPPRTPTSRPCARRDARLAPLDAEGVRAVARLYAGARADAELPVERLVEASGGVPLRLHRAARRVGARQAARRWRAGRIARRARRDCARRRTSWPATSSSCRRRASAPAARRHGDVVCPFKGLASFDVDDADFFFGRERLVAEMVARLRCAADRIVGPSGSGKSSALRAGLLAALADGALPGSERLGARAAAPRRAAAARARAGDRRRGARSGRLVVAVDQFEEVFTACRDEGERAAFVDALVAAARDPRRRALVLVAVRADFYGRCARVPGAVAPAGRQPRPGRADAPRRAAPRDRAAGAPRRPAASSPSSSTR